MEDESQCVWVDACSARFFLEELRLASLGWLLISSGFEEEEEVNAKTQRRRGAKEEGEGSVHLLKLGKSSATSSLLSARTDRLVSNSAWR